MPVRQVKEFLDNNNVKYATITHSAAFTAQEIAALTHTKGRDFAKTVVISIDGAMALAVLPASYQVDLNKLRERTGAAVIALASEAEFRSGSRDAKPARCRRSAISTQCRCFWTRACGTRRTLRSMPDRTMS